MDISEQQQHKFAFIINNHIKFLQDQFFPFIQALDDLKSLGWQGRIDPFVFAVHHPNADSEWCWSEDFNTKFIGLLERSFTAGEVAVGGTIHFETNVTGLNHGASVASGLTFLFENDYFKIGRKHIHDGIVIEGNLRTPIPISTIPTFVNYILDDIWYGLLEKLPDTFPILKHQHHFAPLEYHKGIDTETRARDHIWWLCNKVAERTVQKVISGLNTPNRKALLSGDDSGLISTWEEICVQVQQSDSYHWDLYEDAIAIFAKSIVEDLPEHESTFLSYQLALWKDELDIYVDGGQWAFISDDLIIEDITEKVLGEAGRFRNNRITRYLDDYEDVDEDDDESDVDEDIDEEGT
jgi:hypothetical protein